MPSTELGPDFDSQTAFFPNTFPSLYLTSLYCFLRIILNSHTVKATLFGYSSMSFDKLTESGHHYHSTSFITSKSCPLDHRQTLSLTSRNHRSVPICLPNPECHSDGTLQSAAQSGFFHFTNCMGDSSTLLCSISTSFLCMDKPQVGLTICLQDI